MPTQQTFEFLSQLKLNNNREWFQANKKTYDSVKKQVESLISRIIPELNILDPEIQSPEMKDCVFRIFKDVRFSADKSPYKTNFGAFVAKGGRKTVFPGYYFHFEPGGSFIAGGIYMPQPEILKTVRSEVYFNSAEFRAILDSSDFLKYFSKLDEFDKLKKPPRDFPSDFPEIELLKYRSYIVSVQVPDEKAFNDDYLPYALDVCKCILPLNKFLNRAIGNK